MNYRQRNRDVDLPLIALWRNKVRFDTFDQVAKWYGMTKPLISKHHTKQDDVRPISARNRKWERIKKVSDNKYVLMDGNYGRTMWANNNNNNDPALHEYENNMGPIVWERREDGDYITVTNHNKPNTSVTRYNFLFWHLPSAMRFHYNQSGKHFVRVNNEDYALPKSDYVPVNANGIYSHCTGTLNRLEFRAEPDGTFTRTGDTLAFPTTLVDRDLKKNMKPIIKRIWEDCQLYAPMLDVSWDAQAEYRQQIHDCDTFKQGRFARFWSLKDAPAPLTKAVLCDPTNEAYIPLIAFICADIRLKRVRDAEELRRARSAFTRIINKVLNLYKTEEN